MKEHAVVIAGGGPTGLMLGAELAIAGVDVAIVERRENQELEQSRGLGLHARAIELLDQRGVADRFLAAGTKAQTASFGDVRLDVSDFPTRHNYGLALAQIHTERLLSEWVGELRVPIYRSREVTGFTEKESGIDVALSDGQSLRAQYLVGCDGGRSVVRKLAGIDFPGWDASPSWMMAELETTEEPKWGFHYDATGPHAIGKTEKAGVVRMVLKERTAEATADPTLEELRAALVSIYGTDFGAQNPTSITRFSDMTRQAAHYRRGRVLLAGDATNIRAPLGGQGLGLGLQDAVNLGWKLAHVIKGISPDSLLDTYHAERHPATARTLRYVMAHVAIARADERTKALKDTLAPVIAMSEPRKALAALHMGLDVHYDLGTGHPLLGRRMPDLDLVTAKGTVRVFSLLHVARPVLINFGDPGAIDITPWADRVQQIDATYAGAWELPVIGSVAAPTAVLVRPDGHVAWVANGTLTGLAEALKTWIG